VTASKETLKERLSRYRQIKISVIGRKSGRTVSIPVWFVLEGDKLYLLPVQGSDTQWYKNVLQNPSIRIDARGAEAKLRAQPITEPNLVTDFKSRASASFATRAVERTRIQKNVYAVTRLSRVASRTSLVLVVAPVRNDFSWVSESRCQAAGDPIESESRHCSEP